MLLSGGDSAVFRCRTALAGADPAQPWRHAVKAVRFPAAELAADGRTVRYVYRGYRDATTLTAVADCRIPATPAAIARMGRKLDARRSGQANMDQSVLSSVELAPLTVIACGPGYIGEYPNCYPVQTPTTGGTTSPGDFWDGYESSGGSPATDSPDNHDDVPDLIVGDTIPDCTQSQTQTWALAYCRAGPPEGTRLSWTEKAFDRISTRGAECANIAAFGRDLLASGRLQFYEWQEQDGSIGGWGSTEIGVLLADFWIDDFGDPAGRSQPSFDNKLVHEIEHAMGRGHVEPNQTPNSLACDGL